MTPLTRQTGNHKEQIMNKVRKSNKEERKSPMLSPKEKKAVKQARKHASDVVPLIPY